MSEPNRPSIAKLAEHLLDDEIHVWSCHYRHGAGRGRLRSLLAAYLGLPVECVTLAEEEHGRPVLIGEAAGRLHFNWSHSGDRALIALARSVQPGIDLEQEGRRRRDELTLAKRFFASQEAAALAALPEADRPRAFLQLWTAKEALLKAHGRGLAFGLDRVVLAIESGAPRLAFFDGERLASWQLQALPIEAPWIAAVAWHGAPLQVRWRGAAD